MHFATPNEVADMDFESYWNKLLIDIPGEEWWDIPGLENYRMISKA